MNRTTSPEIVLGAALILPTILVSLQAIWGSEPVFGKVVWAICGGILLAASSWLLTRGAEGIERE